ncbi:MAG: glycogen-binding domain-containing protein [Treponema sp.]|nr:glycogen-binding domain-containing protein [Treponema sp.]MCL2251030.1 glycogen-binding domain-containing protein [Treponema sp.]
MKRISIFIILIFSASLTLLAQQERYDWETFEMIDRLLTIREPSTPIIYDNFVIFSADSSLRRIGIAFAHENFSTIHWYRPLLVSQDRANSIILPGEKVPRRYIDSGVQFHVYQVPENLNELEYRLIINGLWTVDPINPQIRRNPASGLSMSILRIPDREARIHPLNGLPDGLLFTFRGPPGEIVTIGGSFNAWDPFMYELKEGPEGVYSITIPLPSGTYQYVFFHRGKRHADVFNPRRIYSFDGMAASEIIVP